jgi:hypothetical protein
LFSALYDLRFPFSKTDPMPAEAAHGSGRTFAEHRAGRAGNPGADCTRTRLHAFSLRNAMLKS